MTDDEGKRVVIGPVETVYVVKGQIAPCHSTIVCIFKDVTLAREYARTLERKTGKKHWIEPWVLREE